MVLIPERRDIEELWDPPTPRAQSIVTTYGAWSKDGWVIVFRDDDFEHAHAYNGKNLPSNWQYVNAGDPD